MGYSGLKRFNLKNKKNTIKTVNYLLEVSHSNLGCTCSFLFLCIDHRLLLPILFYGNASGRLNILSFLMKCYVRGVFR